MGDMRRAALVIGCGDSDLHGSIASNRSEEGGVTSVEGGNQSDGRLSQSRPGDNKTVKTAPAPTRPS